MCDYPNCSKTGEYLIGVSKAKSNKPARIIGAICAEDMRNSIEKIMGQCFGTIFWVTVFDLQKKLIYHSFDADLQGYSAVVGWELSLDSSEMKSNKINDA